MTKKKAGVQEAMPPAGGSARHQVCLQDKRHCSEARPQAGDQAGARFGMEKQASMVAPVQAGDPKVYHTLLG